MRSDISPSPTGRRATSVYEHPRPLRPKVLDLLREMTSSTANSNDEQPKPLSPESAQNLCGMKTQDSTDLLFDRRLFQSGLILGLVVGAVLGAVSAASAIAALINFR
jgi:hypothetical protein